jgi:hypothetical protein
MGNAQALFAALCETANVDIAAAIEQLVESGADRELARINTLAFAAAHRLDEERTIAAFLHAARLGIFELAWDILCLTCRGVLDITATLKDVHKEPYECALYVNVAARVQGLAGSREIFTTKSVVEYPQSLALLQAAGTVPSLQSAALKGIAGEVAVYKIA